MSIKKVKVSITPADLKLEENQILEKVDILNEYIEDIIKENLDNFRNGDYPVDKSDNIKSKSKREIYNLAFDTIENNLDSIMDLAAEEVLDSYSDYEIAEIIQESINSEKVVSSFEKENKLKFIVEDILHDKSWNNDGETRDFSDTIRRIENGSVAGIFYLDDSIIQSLVDKISKFEKKIKKLSTKLELSKETKQELEALENVISKVENGDIEFHTHTMKKLLSFKSKYLEEDKENLQNSIDSKSKKLQDKLEKRDATKSSYDRISVYGYGDNKEGGELVDYVIKDGDTNQFNQVVHSNSGIADTLESLGEIEDVSFKDLVKKYKSSFDKIIDKRNLKNKTKSLKQ